MVQLIISCTIYVLRSDHLFFYFLLFLGLYPYLMQSFTVVIERSRKKLKAHARNNRAQALLLSTQFWKLHLCCVLCIVVFDLCVPLIMSIYLRDIWLSLTLMFPMILILYALSPTNVQELSCF